jgi:hypothetical protein
VGTIPSPMFAYIRGKHERLLEYRLRSLTGIECLTLDILTSDIISRGMFGVPP